MKAELSGSVSSHVLDELVERVRGRHIANQARALLPHEIVITHDGKDIFAYATAKPAVQSARTAIQALAGRASAVISHWDDGLDEWVQVDPPLRGIAKQRRGAAERYARKRETRTLVASAGKLVRAEIEQSMREQADRLGLELTITEHPHLLTCQVLFEVTGQRHKIDELAADLNAEEMATMRAERAVMLSPL